MMRPVLVLACVLLAPQLAKADLTCAAGENLCCDAVDSSATEYTLTAGSIKGCGSEFQSWDSSNSSTYCGRMVSYYSGSAASSSSCWCGPVSDPSDAGTWNYDCDEDMCMESASGTYALTPGVCDLMDAAEGIIATLGAIFYVIVVVIALIVIGIIAAIYCCCCKRTKQVIVVQPVQATPVGEKA